MCPKCQSVISADFFFCPNCGSQLKVKTMTLTAGDQIKIYLLSFFLPPFGLVPAFKYLKQADAKAKRVGIIAIVLTILSIIFGVWITYNFTASLYKSIDSQLMI